MVDPIPYLNRQWNSCAGILSSLSDLVRGVTIRCHSTSRAQGDCSDFGIIFGLTTKRRFLADFRRKPLILRFGTPVALDELRYVASMFGAIQPSTWRTAMKSMSENAIVKRINRRLAADQKLIGTRGQRARLELGDYHAIDAHTGAITAMHVDPEAWAQELGC